MVVVAAVRDYINRMLQDISGMKVLILDSSTYVKPKDVKLTGTEHREQSQTNLLDLNV